MTRRSLRVLLPGVLLVSVIAAHAGGWAAITVEDLPDYVVAREPVQLTFTVRQHGVTLLNGLRARVEAEAGGVETSALAAPGQAGGQYTALLTLPQPGEWKITIKSGFMNANVTLLPLKAIEPGSRPPLPLPEAERGRRLFVAKGCITCHLHRDVNETSVSVGPELTGRRYPAEYLQQWLANPSPRSATARMPNLDLKQPEIAALVAFINTERQVLQ